MRGGVQLGFTTDPSLSLHAANKAHASTPTIKILLFFILL